jgi:hypothetical protein
MSSYHFLGRNTYRVLGYVQGFVSQFTSYITDNPFNELRFISVQRKKDINGVYVVRYAKTIRK